MMVKMMQCAVLQVILMAVAAVSSFAATISPREKVELTVYNQDFALVKEERKAELNKGINSVRLEEVPAYIDPTSVRIKSVNFPGSLRIIEQSYDFDTVSYGKLLEKYLGREIEIHQIVDAKTGEVRIKQARLLSSGYSPQPRNRGFGMQQVYNYNYSGQPLFEIDGKIHTQATGTLVLPALPEGLILKPMLSWQLEAQKAGSQTVEVSYMTSGIQWIADYVALISPDDTQLDLTGWVTLDNRSGVAYESAKLKLIAGDVHILQPSVSDIRIIGGLAKEASASASPQFKEKAFFEYHLYTLQRPTTIKDNEIKQIEFVTASKVSVKKRYVYDGFQISQQYRNWDVISYRDRQEFGTDSQTKVWVILEFKNSEENNLGIPLPKGRIRLYKEDEDKGQEFVGEDEIDHTPKDEEVTLYAGNAFDLVGERKQLDFKVIESGHIYDETFEITLRNHKQEDVTVTVKEHLYRWKEWEIRNSSHPYEKKDSQTIELSLPVPKDGQTKLAYTARYRW